MDHFINGFVIGLIVGVWLSAAFLYVLATRHPMPAPIHSGVEPPTTGDVKPPRPFILRLDSPGTRDNFHRLVVMARGDRALAERLVAHEHRRSPDAIENTLILNAISRWQQDNR